MDTEFKKMQSYLSKLHSISRELNALLPDGETDAIFEKLKQRQEILTELQEKRTDVDNRSRQNKELKTMVSSIIHLDKKNLEVMQKKLKTASDSITDLGKEQKAIKNLRSVTKKDQKQLIDFLH